MIRQIALGIGRTAASILLPRPTLPFDPGRIEKILIYATFGIGDTILFAPALKAIRRRFPKARIVLLSGASWTGELVPGHLADEIRKYIPDHWEIYKLAAQVRKEQFDLLIGSYLCLSKHLVELTLLSGIPWRAGHVSGPNWPSDADFLFNIPAVFRGEDHGLDIWFRLAEALGCETGDRQPSLPVDSEAEAFAERFFRDNGLSEKDWTLAVQVGTARTQDWKQWDVKKLAQTCDRILEDRGTRIILLGSAEHKNTLDELLGLMRHSPVVALGKTSLKQSAALIRKCRAALCNDSGMMHLSAAVGVPVVAVFGPTDPRRTAPVGDGHILVRKEVPCSPCYALPDLSASAAKSCAHRNCLAFIAPEDVVAAVHKIRDDAKDRV